MGEGFSQLPVVLHQVSKEGWNQDSLGNQRVIVEVGAKGRVAKAVIAWRRRDAAPELKGIIVVDAKTGQSIHNWVAEDFTRASGTVYFEPVSGPGTYYIYYMPYTLKGGYYPTTDYLPMVDKADPKWKAGIGANKNLVHAKVVAIESVDAFNAFGPMEQIATKAETTALVQRFSKEDFLVFAEDRMHPIRMRHDLPVRWIKKGAEQPFKDTVDKGENYSFQIGVFAHKEKLQDLKLVFSDLVNSKNNAESIPATAFSCINTEGVNWLGAPETFEVNVPKGEVQALWSTVQIATSTSAGIYKGRVAVQAKGAKTKYVAVELVVNDRIAKDHGVDEPWKQTRLAWLSSTLGSENKVFAPYTPLIKKESTIDLLGRQVEVAPTGLPGQIRSFFSSSVTSIGDSSRSLFTEPVHFHFTKSDGKDIKFTTSPITYKEQTDGRYAWHADNQSKELDMQVDGSLEFDGFMNYVIKVTALEEVSLKNVSLHFAMVPAAAKYIMGLGLTGQQTPDTVNWHWQVKDRNQDGAWVGDVNAGLQYSLRDEHYVRPLNTNFYLQKPLLLPTSWGNEGKGGIKMFQKGTAYLLDNYTGERRLNKGDTLYFNFRLLITPFHTLDTKGHFENRYIHKYLNTDSVKALGASVVNIHQGTDINPYINYPFIKTAEMKAYIDSAHKAGLKVKIYNTVRELSNRAYELPALFSLNHEIFSKGEGGGYSWLREHLDQDYIAAWYTPEQKDAAIVNSGMSRWHNYYVEGMNWLTKNIGIDGVYLDDVAFDRNIMKRVKTVLTTDGHPGLIDLHSASQFNDRDGYINSAMLYMELFPYLSRLWFGERFDYEKSSKDYYLTEMSGIPFGLMGEMLENDGNPWRGMLYGMTNRLLWSETADPRPLWKVWDDFGISDAKMIGYWANNCPVKSDNDLVPVTVYQRKGRTLLAVASWAKKDIKVRLLIDWQALGLDPTKATLKARAIDGFQQERHFSPSESIEIQAGKGWLLELSQ